MNVSDAIRFKRAVRKFTPEPLTEETILAILNAGRRAQSSKNSQPWHFITITDKGILKQLSECGYAGGVGPSNASHIAGAALAVAILTPDPLAKFQTMFDAGQAAAYMQLAAWELGIGSCPASIYEPERARQILGFPDVWHLRMVLSFGYPLQVEKLTSPPNKGGRRTLDDIVHREKW